MATDNNPKAIAAQLAQGNTGLFEAVADPVRAEVRKAMEQRKMLHQQPVVPFLDNGDVSLALITKLCKFSPTNAGVLRDVRHFVIGGQFDVNQRKVSGFARRTQAAASVTDDEFQDYTTWLSTWIDPAHLQRTWAKVFDNWAQYGNGFVEVVFRKVGNARKVDIYNHDADRCLYLATDDGDPKVILISPFWYHTTNYGTEAQAVPLWPQMVQHEDGSLRTMLHIKQEVPGREWYGESYWLSCLYYAYMELQSGQYNVEGFQNGFTGQVFFETYEGYSGGMGEETPPNNYQLDAEGNYAVGPQGFYSKVVQFFTRNGDKKRSVMHRNAAADSKQTFVHQFKPNTDHQFHEATARLAEAQIIKAHNWHPSLMGVQVPGKLGASQEFETAFKTKFFTVIKPMQDFMTDPLNQIVAMAADWMGGEGPEIVKNYSLGYKNIYWDMLVESGEKDETAETGNSAAGVPAAGPEDGKE